MAKHAMLIPGHATHDGTAAYAKRFAGILHPSHFREKLGLFFSSIGIGSYLGETDDATDLLYESALKEALLSGINVVDTAVNYRCQRSEKCFGRALADLIREGAIRREEIIICTKGGFIPFEDRYPEDPSDYFRKTYLDTKILNRDDVVQGCHAMTPGYLSDQLERSRRNLGLECIDIYYIHNPETQLAEVDRRGFLERMRAAFDLLEGEVRKGRIRFYGTATWNGYRVPADQTEHLALEELAVIAREIGGADHHFRAVQLPFSLAMPEAWVVPSQPFAASSVPVLGLMDRLGMIAVGSASLLQARLLDAIPGELRERFTGISKPAQCALQFARSVSGITTALAGMKRAEHVRENIATAKSAALSNEDLIKMFGKGKA